jgi:hypothetical protein
MKIFGYALLGALLTGALCAIAGFFFGGSIGMAPCGKAPDFLTGALFGSLVAVGILGLPATLVGAIIGAVVGYWKKRSQHRVAR